MTVRSYPHKVLSNMLYFRCLIIWIFYSLVLVPVLHAEPLRYVALGDSYTIGTGVDRKDNWPSQLARRLTDSGIEIKVAGNPARAGRMTQQVIDRQLRRLPVLKPDFVTLLIGVNDWIHDASGTNFRRRLQVLMDRILESLPHPNRLLVVTIPDFSCSPQGMKLGYGKSAVNGITRFNTIIQSEAESRKVKVADIFESSQKACSREGMFAGDGLHPSSRQYALWVDTIFPTALELLKN